MGRRKYYFPHIYIQETQYLRLDGGGTVYLKATIMLQLLKRESCRRLPPKIFKKTIPKMIVDIGCACDMGRIPNNTKPYLRTKHLCMHNNTYKLL